MGGPEILMIVAVNVAIYGGGFAILFYGGRWLHRKLKEYVK